MRGTHATAHDVTVIKRIHKDSVHKQNRLDGTKERCYELILRKHLSGVEFETAMKQERRKFRRWSPLAKATKRLVKRLRPRRLRSALRTKLSARSSSEKVDPRIQSFLHEVKNIDHRLILNR